MLRIRRKYKKNLLLLFFTILICIIFFESSLRLIYPLEHKLEKEYTLSDYGIFMRIPNLEYFSSREEYTQHMKINSKGLRDYEYGYNKNGSIYRIAMVGDSFTEGRQVKLEETIPKRLDGKLGRNYEVINFGHSGFGLIPEAVLITEEIKKYNPDMVILNYYIGNDLTKIDFGAYKYFPDEFWSEKNETLKMEVYSKDKKLIIKNFFRRNSMIYFLIKKSIRNIDNEESYLKIRPIYKKEYDETLNKNLDKTFLIFDYLKRFSLENKISFIVVLIPAKEQVDLDYLNKILEQNNEEIKNYEIKKLQKLLKNMFENMEIDYIDLLDRLSEEDDIYFEIDAHFNNKGYKIAAEIIHEELINRELLNKKDVKQ